MLVGQHGGIVKTTANLLNLLVLQTATNIYWDLAVSIFGVAQLSKVVLPKREHLGIWCDHWMVLATLYILELGRGHTRQFYGIETSFGLGCAISNPQLPLLIWPECVEWCVRKHDRMLKSTADGFDVLLWFVKVWLRLWLIFIGAWQDNVRDVQRSGLYFVFVWSFAQLPTWIISEHE